jgi:O-acetyl-ADP-ribose deacetylase (regulator of RNase III)
MKEIKGNIFDINADAICVTTNGVTKANGELVMGKGIALEFKNKFPSLPAVLGKAVKKNGNVVHVNKAWEITPYNLGNTPSYHIISFPTKHDWRDKSDINLIIQSAQQAVIVADKLGLKKVLLPRPGCGLGGLNWEKEVKPAIEGILDDRFWIVTPVPEHHQDLIDAVERVSIREEATGETRFGSQDPIPKLHPAKDGIDHINVYSKGNTELGVYLSNFTSIRRKQQTGGNRAPIFWPALETEDGLFSSVEGYWYWLGVPEGTPGRDRLKSLYGLEAKKVGRELRGKNWQDSAEFKRKICGAIRNKVMLSAKCQSLMRANTLPYVHYYVMQGNVVIPKEGQWIWDFITELEKELKGQK